MFLKLQLDFFDNCTFADDMSYRNDGYIDLFRNGGGHTEKKMEKVLKYEIQNDCKMKTDRIKGWLILGIIYVLAIFIYEYIKNL